MRGPPVVLTNTLGRPVTNIYSERGAVPMTVVNTLGEPVTLVASGGEPVTLFNANGTLWDFPFSLFANNEQGAWYDPSDFSTLFQNSTGTTPVTAVEQPVRLMLDRSRGLVLGSELITNGDFATDSDWTKGTGWTITGGQAVATAVASGQALRQTIVAPTNVSYWIEFNIVVTSGGVNVWMGTSGTFFSVTSSGLSRVLLRASGANDITISAAVTGFTGTIDNVSIKALPGNHALAPNDASRPVLRSRYNLLERSEEFDNAYWSKTRTSISANVGVAPDGTTTADKLIENTDTNTHTLFPNSALTLATTTSYTYSIYAKAAERTIIHLANNDLVGAFFNLSDGTVSDIAAGFTASITAAGSGWYRCVLTQALNSNASGRLVVRLVSTGTTTSYTGDGTSGILIWGAQLLTAADQTSTGGAYQRIAAATDYDTSNPVWRPYLAFDGTDDSFSTSSIDFSGTDEVTVFAGVTKLSDAATAIVMSYNGTSNASAEMFAPRASGANGDFAFSHRTTTVQEAGAGTVVLSPTTAVLTGISDISAPSVQLRRNGAVVQTVTTAIDANNYTSGTIRVGHRSSNLYLNGRIYSLAVLGRTATAAEIGAMEAWVNGKTGAY